MESFGKFLKEARIAKNIDLNTIAAATSVNKEYLEALEEEDLDRIPGETYVTGFLRLYSDYLGLDTQYLIRLQKAKVLQESPTPVELLQIKKGPLHTILIALLILAILVAIGTGGFFFYKYLDSKKKEGVTNLSMTNQEPQNYQLTSILNTRVYSGDKITIPFKTGNIEVSIDSTLTNLKLGTIIGTQTIELGEELDLDITGDAESDITIFVADISKSTEDRGAEISASVKTKILDSLAISKIETEISETDKSDSNSQIVLFEGKRAYPFTIIATFNNNCFFRHQSDRKEIVSEYLKSGDVLNQQSNNTIRIWASNAGSCKMQVQGDGTILEVEMGKPGQVVVKDIKWIKEADGTYKLVVSEVE